MTKDDAIDWLDEMIENCVSATHYNDKNRGNKLEALRIAKANLLDTRERVTTLEEWISSFDNCDCVALSQMEQLEIKSMLIELKWYRDKAGVSNG
jgi:hypothetical protein